MKKLALFTLAATLAAGVFARDTRTFSHADLPQPGQMPPPPPQAMSCDFSPIAISLLPDASLPGRRADIGFLRINLIAGAHHDVTGIDIGLVGNIAEGAMSGLEIGGIFNRAEYLSGLQIGLVNYAAEADGVQIGLVNMTHQMAGLQIGLANCIRDSKVPFFPVVNFQF